jgi:hypothetical protein
MTEADISQNLATGAWELPRDFRKNGKLVKPATRRVRKA